ncbi:MAG: NRDE family protein [Chitinophagaceae bacterium]|nr:NRDE family protein [Chitinophagaceae bacterium]
MCTVTFIPSEHTVFLTSNRDEKQWRSPASLPAVYTGKSGKILFPRDGDAGGTWIAAHENANAIVFLNGGFFAHSPQPPYRKSRGLILIDLIDHSEPTNHFLTIDLSDIEPFTAIIWNDSRLFECRWDGEQKHVTELDSTRPHIWSSVTLYDPAVIAKRNHWFAEWVQEKKTPLQDDILHFHQFTGDGDCYNDLKMNRGQVFTVSVTSMSISREHALMRYLDLKNNQSFQQELVFEKSMAGKYK